MNVKLRKSTAESPFSFVFVDDNGDIVIKSESYKQKTSAKNGIESVKKNSQVDKNYIEKKSKNGKFFFNIKALNGQIVGTSSFYASEAEMKSAMANFKKNAKKAKVVEE